MIATNLLVGRDDLEVQNWVIIDLSKNSRTEGLGRHIFGFSNYTGVWQISSPILEETETYIRTRSRKYFKDGPSTDAYKTNSTARRWLNTFLGSWQIDRSIIDEILLSLNDE